MLHVHSRGPTAHAEWYDRCAGILARPLDRRVAADVAHAELSAGVVVLDIGTGPGRVPLLIAAGYPQLNIEGIDLSSDMVARATANARHSQLSAAHRSDFRSRT